MNRGSEVLPPASAGMLQCGLCGRHLPKESLKPTAIVSGAVRSTLSAEAPTWEATGWICVDDLQAARHRTIEEMIREERGELTSLDREVLESLGSSDTVTTNPEVSFEKALSAGDRLADSVANFVGSWTFILSFVACLLLWIALNSLVLLLKPFDPYPFILLNLLLSCVAAIQAPLIMMSQKRQEAKDRLRSENDYKINLKAELEIRRLHEKIDHHLLTQWEHLSRIQEAQAELARSLGRDAATLANRTDAASQAEPGSATSR